MSDIKKAKILVVEKSPDEANNWINFFREADYFVEASFAGTLAELKEKLASQEWSLVLFRLSRDVSLMTEEALGVIKQADINLPCILLYSGSLHGGVVHWMQLGIADAIPINMPDRLVLSAERAMEVVSLRRKVQHSLFSLPEVEDYERMILNNTTLGVLRLDQGRITYANKEAAELFGYASYKELKSMEVQKLISCEQGIDGFDQAIEACEKNYKISDFGESEGIAKGGTTFHTRIIVMPYINAVGKVKPQLVIESAGTSAKFDPEQAFEQEIIHNDDNIKLNLFGYELSNKHLSKLQSLLLDLSEKKDSCFLILMHLENSEAITIKEKKYLIQESLLAFKNKMLQQMEVSDTILIEECQCLLTCLYDLSEQEACRKISRLSQSLESLIINYQGNTFQPAASIGLVPFNKEIAITYMLERGLECLKRAARKGINGWHLFELADDIEAQAEAGDELAMVEYAMQKNKTYLQFQPIASLNGDQTEYYEVLLRLYTIDGNSLPAARFIHSIENHTLAIKVDRWVVLQALKLLVKNKKEKKDVNLFVHLSPATIKDQQFMAWVYIAIKKAGINPAALILQFGEESAVGLQSDVKRLVNMANKIGCRTSMCRFGVAIEPENLVDKISTHFVKLNPKFVDYLQQENEIALRRLTQMLKTKTCHIIIPHVETAEMLTLVWRLQSDYVQGYFLQKPKEEMDYDFSMEG